LVNALHKCKDVKKKLPIAKISKGNRKKDKILKKIYVKKNKGNTNKIKKPQDLLRSLIRQHVPPNGLVLDLCAGSHSLMVACIAEGVNCISIERDARQHLAALRVVQAKINVLQLREQSYQDRVLQALKVGETAPADTVLPPSHDAVLSVVKGVLIETLVVETPQKDHAQFGNACLKCAKAPIDPENPLLCFLCKSP